MPAAVEDMLTCKALPALNFMVDLKITQHVVPSHLNMSYEVFVVL